MKIKIDNRTVRVTDGTTVLDAAEAHKIYVPHLCSHPELTPYGGCRLCIVEIDGIKGYPTACTTKVKEGMTVRTRSGIIQEMRKEIVQLILSEHPSGCLVCDEQDECANTQETIRKVGATTGCRWCSKDGDCELQRVVKGLEIDAIEFPVYYQDRAVEKYDPFFDRDYNLCIYCGRCIRICEEHRKSDVLGLNQRGKEVIVGPAFHQTHVDADCEFCGACVSVCPTGALAEKGKKWAGVPDSYHKSICPLCSLNCDIQVPVKNDRIIGTLPPGNPHQSGGELCVKGRFCLSQAVNHPDRLKEPVFRFLEGTGFITWEDAMEKAIPHLTRTDGKKIAFYVSPNLPLEEMAAVNQFAHLALNCPNVTSSALNETTLRYLALAERSIPLKKIEESDAIITFFLKGSYNYAPLTLAIKRAAHRGVPFCQVGWTRDSLSRFATLEMTPPAGKERLFARKIVRTLEKGKGSSREVKKLVKLIQRSSSPTIVLGPEIMYLTQGEDILNSIEYILQLTRASVFAPNPYGNLTGLLSAIDIKLKSEIDAMVADGNIDVLFIIGDTPYLQRPPVEFIIYQGALPPPDNLRADLVLPAATWGEVSGTYAYRHSRNHGKLKFRKAVVKPPGQALCNSKIFNRLTRAIGIPDLKYTRKETRRIIPKNLALKFFDRAASSKKHKKLKVIPPSPAYPHFLIREKPLHAVQSPSLSSISSGLSAIVPEDTLIINPEDAAKLGLKDGDPVMVETAGNRGKEITPPSYPLKIQKNILPGFVMVLSNDDSPGFETNPCAVHLRRSNV